MSKTVLVVEDNDLNLKLFNELLQANGYDTLQASDGHDAVDISRRFHPDLVLMDICLPGMSGLEATQRIKSDPETADIPVVAVTANAMKGDEQSVLEGGCDGYIAKPISIGTFLEVISQFLDEKPAADGPT